MLMTSNVFLEPSNDNLYFCFIMKDVVLAILITDCQLVSIVKMKKFVVHNLDLHLIFNLVSASESFKTAESWTPVCLPKFDPK